MKWKNLRMPEAIVWEVSQMTSTYGRLVAEPLERGYGITMGNALRRVLLSSLQGAAITAVRVDGVLHEFSAVEGVTEDVTELVLNLKQLNVRLLSDGPETLVLTAEDAGEVRASDFDPNPNLEILNQDLHVATLGPSGRLSMEVIIGPGRGYVQAEDHEFEDRPIGFIPVDSVFSPVKRVHYHVENTRVGQRTDYDKLTLEVWTNGTVTPEEALSFASKILKDHLLLFMDFEIEPHEEEEEIIDEEQQKLMKLLDHSVDELELSVRSSNCLREAGIKTLYDLVKKSEAEMLKYRNFGRKSLQELVDILSDMGLHFGMDVDDIMRLAEMDEGDEDSDDGDDDVDGGGDEDGNGDGGDESGESNETGGVRSVVAEPETASF